MKRNLQKGILVTSACAAFLLGNVQQAYAVAADAIEIVQQNKKIAGTVVDQNGEAVIGANVIQKGTTNGTITDIDGKFTLEVPAKAVLTVSFIGYQSQEVALKGNETQLTVTLKDDTEVLDEVVVVGYGTMKKRDLSGAVSQIKSDDLMKGNPTDLSQGLAGKVAGVQINAADGAPGGGVSIQVRGTNSFSTSSQPLFIVDGVPFDAGSTPASDANQNSNNTSNPLSFINPHDIQSIEVLKDASATAIYGSRGANGVVIITTKRGEAGYEQVEFSSNFSFSRIANKVKVLDAATYASYINEQDLNSYQYDGKPYAQLSYPGMWSYPSLPDGTLDYENGKYLPSPEDYRNPGYYTDEYGNQTWVGGADWQDLIYQNGFSQEYNLSVSGGSEKGWHAFSGNFLNQDGIIKESGFTRYALRANIGRKMYKWLEMGMNINFTHTETDFSKTNSNDYGVIRSSLIFPPNYDPTLSEVYATTHAVYFPIPRTIPGEVNNKLYYETELGNTSVDFTVQIPEVSISGLYNEFALPGSSIKVNGAYFDLYGFGGGEESSTITMNGVALEVDSLTEQYMSIVIPENTSDNSTIVFSWESASGTKTVSVPYRNTTGILWNLDTPDVYGFWAGTELITTGNGSNEPAPLNGSYFRVKGSYAAWSWNSLLCGGCDIPAEAAANPSDYWFKFEVNSANGNPFYDSASVGYLIQLNGGQYAWNPSANGSFNTYGNWCTVRLELSEVATNGINAGWNNLFWIMQPNSDWNTDHSFANIRIEKKQ